MKIALLGASGFIGRYLKRALRAADHDLTFILREGFNKPVTDFCAEYIDYHDVVINLCGAPLSKRWNETYKQELLDSRILTTRKITEAILYASNPPKTFINASSVGIYNDEKTQTEDSQAFADNFLGKLCQAWESEAMKANEKCRVVILRIGLVLAKDEGTLKKMMPPFRSGIGATVGNGNQGVSWIHIDDLTEIFLFVINHPEIQGILNAVGENPTDNFHFSEMLGKMYGQPVYFSIPRFALKLIYGEGAQVLIDGQRVIPEKLLKSGFQFQHPTLTKALVDLYKKQPSQGSI